MKTSPAMPGKPTGSYFLQLVTPAFLVLLAGSLFFSKTSSFLFLNSYHHPLFEQFFHLVTYLGDGLFAVILALFCWLWSRRTLALKLMASFLVSGIAAQVLKSIFHAPRPKAFISSSIYPHFLEGITHSGWNSFPSGHTTTVFAIAATLAFNGTCKFKCTLYFILALLTLYSRIYLGQHFLEDTTAGVLLGILSALLVEELAKNRSLTGAFNWLSHAKPLRIEW